MVLGCQVQNEDGQSYLQAIELTQDHKPDNPEECRRIVEAGGRVDRLVSGELRGCPCTAKGVKCWYVTIQC